MQSCWHCFNKLRQLLMAQNHPKML